MTSLKITYPNNNDHITFLTKEQFDFYKDENRFIPHEPELTPREIDLTFPAPVNFTWEPACSGIVQISSDPDFSLCENFPGNNGSAPVCNLLHDKTYFCRVKVNDEFSPVVTFSVDADKPRWINLPQVTNVRDLGLWKNGEGKRIKQGMLFRGAQFNSERAQKQLITDEGIKILLDQLHVHMELDLRGETEGSKFVPVERYEKISMSAYATWGEYGIFTDEQQENVRKVFDILADETAYPIYFHCAGGGDRTGTIAFLLEALLGLDEESLVTEYELSNLSVSGERHRFTEVWTKFMEKLETYVPGGTRKEQVVALLKTCGVTDETMNKIQDVLLEPVK